MAVHQLRHDAPQPDLMGPDGFIKLLAAASYDEFDQDGLRLWCHHHARYGLPTVELIAWLKAYVGDRRVIEIGSGAGDLAHHLGIKGTDSKMQRDNPQAALYYQMLRQPAIRYPASVEKLEALKAIQKYRPAVVIASWVTHWVDPNKALPPGGGCMFGVREDKLLATGVTYVFIGHLLIHQYKPIRQRPHREFTLPFLRSRAQDQSQNRIMIWNE